MADDKRKEAHKFVAYRMIAAHFENTYVSLAPFHQMSHEDRNEILRLVYSLEYHSYNPTNEQYDAAVDYLASLNPENPEETAQQE